jgi:hypothetical protein
MLAAAATYRTFVRAARIKDMNVTRKKPYFRRLRFQMICQPSHTAVCVFARKQAREDACFIRHPRAGALLSEIISPGKL